MKRWVIEQPITFRSEPLAIRIDATYIFPQAGPSSPAALTRARGEFDGIAFEQTDYFHLAHRPDHHNNGAASWCYSKIR